MCQPGEIVVIEKFLDDEGRENTRHSFVVLSNEAGKVEGIDYNLVLALMSSFRDKSEEYRERKLKYLWNIPVTAEDTDMIKGNSEDGFIKGNQLHYFDLCEDEIDIIGSVNATVWDRINEVLEEYDDKIIINTYNLKSDKVCES